ncbi:MAG: iron complex transport system ATP-binding protein [Desulfonauticus sp.]|nr:iron complex transport system ATP-binding protein [Desulfonauticus sp.]
MTNPKKHQLEVKNLSFGYEDKKLLQNISFSLVPGQIKGILGPNGSGKTTLFFCLSGFLKYKGQVLIQGQEVQKLPSKKRALLLSLATQNPAFPEIRVKDYLLLARFPYLSFLGQYRREDFLFLEERLKEMQLINFQAKNLAHLSGGEQKQVLLAKILTQDTPFILLDEITSNLDPKICLQILKLLKQKAKEKNKAILLTSHDLNLAAQLCSELIFIKKGKIIAQGKTKEVFKTEILEEVYETQFKIYHHPDNNIPQALLGF